MIVKQRKIPLTILKLQALLRRLPSNHIKVPIITEDLKKRMAGYKGECSLDYQFSFLDTKHFFILHDLRLPDDNRYFQMDSVLLSRKMCLIIEVKNIAGSLLFDPVFKQLIRTKDGKEMAFSDPITQAERHEAQLKTWFQNNRLPQIPICSLVVISNPQSIIRSTTQNHLIRRKVIHLDILANKIEEIENSNSHPVLEEKEIKKITRHFLKQHTELDPSIGETYNISKEEFVKGVICPNCNHPSMIKKHGASWYCPKCSLISQNAHLPAIRDYQLLIGNTIANSQLRDFLQIHSSAAATRIFQTLMFKYTGTRKNRVYTISSLDNFEFHFKQKS
ncbi:nuclease-related domain-containing protein [Niallia endozanthoxylica]|nr:nuclease-related domain-containing protein [Niallia endozanthoxylica]